MDASDVVFSPSGTRFITLSNAPNPQSKFPPSDIRSAALWQIETDEVGRV